MKLLITTTGTSLLTNAAKQYGKNKAEITDNELRHYFEIAGSEAASAETNSLLKIVEPNDFVSLLHTATPDGSRCAQQIKNYLQSNGWNNVSLRQLELEENESQFERHGLRNLVNTLIDEITTGQREGKDVMINATGGFKAQIAYTTMVGTIFQIPVKYIYQNFQKPVTFPPLPITWNLGLLIQYDHFFTWIDEEPRSMQLVWQRLQSIQPSDRIAIEQLLLFPNENDNSNEIFLSAAGDILWQRVQQQRQIPVGEPPPSDIPTVDKISNSLTRVRHHYPRGTREFAETVASLSAVEEIIGGHFENTTNRRIKNVFDDGTIRVLWADNEKATNLTIRTTARGQAQTLQFAERFIKPLLQ
ncbi:MULTISPECIES: putative CRISPR-associated protein [unclassified Synechocystis]|uniref:putative CRISPR-associated protein n=1 Tax=unclassified Synechocystis TaxID=2640012 RepID=UPI000423C017|nr:MULTISPECIES: putative CRISPR-associated protein [unclassified Synechocystis]AIE73559.1 CRISPR-associated protein APE2256 [Synechocystis sp. PCC 6714]MCT0254107.1 putative CRISPR-associated protein [Synechocystis sp. CS-94]